MWWIAATPTYAQRIAAREERASTFRLTAMMPTPARMISAAAALASTTRKIATTSILAQLIAASAGCAHIPLFLAAASRMRTARTTFPAPQMCATAMYVFSSQYAAMMATPAHLITVRLASAISWHSPAMTEMPAPTTSATALPAFTFP